MQSRGSLLADGAAEAVYHALLGAYGPQHWWPADTPFEVMVGAVLIQRTAWRNAELALAALRERALLEPRALAACPPAALEPLVRPAGFYRQKAARLRALADWVCCHGGTAALARLALPELRPALLALPGIGPETADAMALYAFQHASFVIDAYTRRLFSRLGLVDGNETYDALKAAFERALPPRAALYNEYHALIVAHAKARCRPRPLCGGCPLRGDCRGAIGVEPSD